MFRLFGLFGLFVQVQTFRRVPPVLPCNFCHTAHLDNFHRSPQLGGFEMKTLIRWEAKSVTEQSCHLLRFIRLSPSFLKIMIVFFCASLSFEVHTFLHHTSTWNTIVFLINICVKIQCCAGIPLPLALTPLLAAFFVDLA